jgi:hypothetical protein
VLFSNTIIIEDDSMAWIYLIRYGVLIKQNNEHNSANKIININKDDKLECRLWNSQYVLIWKNKKFIIKIVTVDSHETAHIYLEDKDTFDAFHDFLITAKHACKAKKSKDKDHVIVNILDDGNIWSTVSRLPKRCKTSLVMKDNVIDDLINDISVFYSNEEELLYDAHGLPYKRNYLLIGKPGSGKSSTVHVIASEFNLDIHFLTILPNMTERTLSNSIINLNENSLLVIEDIQHLTGEKYKTVIGVLTNILDGTLHRRKLITIMTSSSFDNLDSTLIRPGRVDYTCKFEKLTSSHIYKLICNIFSTWSDNEKKSLQKLILDVISPVIDTFSTSKVIHFLFKYKRLSYTDFDTHLCQSLLLYTDGTSEYDRVNTSNSQLYM